jgi:hypothetical protein
MFKLQSHNIAPIIVVPFYRIARKMFTRLFERILIQKSQPQIV